MAKHDRTERLVDLRAKLQAREGIPAYGMNCIELRKEIARLESLGDD